MSEKVASIVPAIEQAKARERMARLSGLLETQRKQIEEDPWPMLTMMGEEIARLRGIIDSAKAAAYPPIEYEGPDTMIMVSIGTQSYQLLSDVRHVLSKA
jgi:hypothetical protein